MYSKVSLISSFWIFNKKGPLCLPLWKDGLSSLWHWCWNTTQSSRAGCAKPARTTGGSGAQCAGCARKTSVSSRARSRSRCADRAGRSCEGSAGCACTTARSRSRCVGDGGCGCGCEGSAGCACTTARSRSRCAGRAGCGCEGSAGCACTTARSRSRCAGRAGSAGCACTTARSRSRCAGRAGCGCEGSAGCACCRRLHKVKKDCVQRTHTLLMSFKRSIQNDFWGLQILWPRIQRGTVNLNSMYLRVKPLHILDRIHDNAPFKYRTAIFLSKVFVSITGTIGLAKKNYLWMLRVNISWL